MLMMYSDHLNFVSGFFFCCHFLFCLSSIFIWRNCLCCCALLFTGWSFSMGSAYQFHSWRVFVVVCALPCVCAVVALTFMPESPRFYLEVNSFEDAVVSLGNAASLCCVIDTDCLWWFILHWASSDKNTRQNWEHLVVFQPHLTKIMGLIPKQAFICSCKMEA